MVSGGRVCRRHDLPIVEADHRDVAGHDDAALAQRVDDAAGDLVVAAEDAIRRGRRGLEQRATASWPQSSRPGADAATPCSGMPLGQHGAIGRRALMHDIEVRAGR